MLFDDKTTISDMTKKTKSALLKIGLYQIIGGAIGILIILYAIVQSTNFAGLSILLYLFMSLFFGFSILCGTICLKADEKALKFSLINQYLQIIGFAFFGFAFTYTAGLYVAVGLDFAGSTTVTFSLTLSKLDLNINREADRAEIHLNLVAIALIYWLDNLITQEKLNNQISTVDTFDTI